jgi:voltage-gated sodium channel
MLFQILKVLCVDSAQGSREAQRLGGSGRPLRRAAPPAEAGAMSRKRDDIDKLVQQFKASRDEDSDSDPDEPPRRKPFVDYFSFNLAVGGLIALNALTMGLETDARGQDGDDVSSIWYFIELIFCCLFLAELCARLYYHRLTFFTNIHGKWWNMADFVIVMISVLDTFLLTPIGTGGGMRIISMLRFIRLMRLIRLIRLMRLFKELWLVASGLFESAKTLCWVAIMIVCFLYICAIFTTLVIGKNDKLYDQYFLDSKGWDHEVYFGTVSRSMFSLFQIVTFESWSERIVRHVMQKQPAMVLFFIVFIAISSFGLLNIVVGVVVESTLHTSENDESKVKRAQERDRQRVFDHLREIFEGADEDGSGTLTLAEVQKAIAKPEIYNKLKMIEFPVEDPKQIFMLLDYDNTCELSIDEFISGCIRMKGQAKSKDLLAAQVAVDTMKRHYTYFEREMKELQSKIALLDDTARALVYQGEHVFLNLREYRMRHPELEGGAAAAPRISTSAIEHAPWERLNKQGNEGNQIKQGAIWDQAFNKNETNDTWGMVPYGADNTSSDMVLYNNINGNDKGERCPYCGQLFDENAKKFCTSCGKERPQALTDGNNRPQASTNGNMQALTNGSNNSPSRRNNVQETALALPGSV